MSNTPTNLTVWYCLSSFRFEVHVVILCRYYYFYKRINFSEHFHLRLSLFYMFGFSSTFATYLINSPDFFIFRYTINILFIYSDALDILCPAFILALFYPDVFLVLHNKLNPF